MALILAPILIGFFFIMVGMAAAAMLAQSFEDYVPPSDAPVQADEEAPDGPELR